MKDKTSKMDEYDEADLREMGLMDKDPAVKTETVFLRNLDRRTKLFNDFTEATKDGEKM